MIAEFVEPVIPPRDFFSHARQDPLQEVTVVLRGSEEYCLLNSRRILTELYELKPKVITFVGCVSEGVSGEV